MGEGGCSNTIHSSTIKPKVFSSVILLAKVTVKPTVISFIRYLDRPISKCQGIPHEIGGYRSPDLKIQSTEIRT